MRDGGCPGGCGRALVTQTKPWFDSHQLPDVQFALFRMRETHHSMANGECSSWPQTIRVSDGTYWVASYSVYMTEAFSMTCAVRAIWSELQLIQEWDEDQDEQPWQLDFERIKLLPWNCQLTPKELWVGAEVCFPLICSPSIFDRAMTFSNTWRVTSCTLSTLLGS